MRALMLDTQKSTYHLGWCIVYVYTIQYHPIYGDDFGMVYYWVYHKIGGLVEQLNFNRPIEEPAPSWLRLGLFDGFAVTMTCFFWMGWHVPMQMCWETGTMSKRWAGQKEIQLYAV